MVINFRAYEINRAGSDIHVNNKKKEDKSFGNLNIKILDVK